MNEAQLIEKLRRVENLFAGAATEGEQEAAASALDRMRRRLEELPVGVESPYSRMRQEGNRGRVSIFKN